MFLIYFRLIILFIIGFFWWKDVSYERFSGRHNNYVYFGLQISMLFFILFEVFFFVRFFWSYFHSCWSLKEDLGFNWPPIKFKKIIIDPFSIPLLNTIILLSSGVRVTLTHHSIIKKKYYYSFYSLLLTCIFGFYFMFLQINEYALSYYSLNSKTYGTIFFLLTGFHGLHVTVGAIFLLVCLFRLYLKEFKKKFHVGFECAAWYWHFVDVVWIFLFFFVYWYGCF